MLGHLNARDDLRDLMGDRVADQFGILIQPVAATAA